MIDNAGCLEDLRVPPANRLEKLDGDRKGQYSIRINDQYRICFQVEGNNFFDGFISDNRQSLHQRSYCLPPESKSDTDH